MKNISDLPTEVILLVFVNLTFFRDLFALSKTSKRFRRLLKQHEQSISKAIAVHKYSVPYKVLGFSGHNPSISRLLVLDAWSTDINAILSACNDMRHGWLGDDKNGVWRAIWYTPLWQEHLALGLFLFKMLSLSASILERLEQLPAPFHPILRFTSIVTSDMIRANVAIREGEAEVMRVRRVLQSGWAPGDKAPWILNDIPWRAMELCLFEHGGGPFLRLISLDQSSWIQHRQHRRRRRPSVLEELKSGRLAQHRRYHLRLDELCLANGRAWGGPSFWRSFDPFEMKDSGLSGSNALEEMVKRLPR